MTDAIDVSLNRDMNVLPGRKNAEHGRQTHIDETL